MSIDVTAITSADWSRKVGELGEVVEQIADIEQAMGIILSTPKGSDPHRPEFGCDVWQYLDHPGNTGIPGMIREATDALSDWEPRAEVTNITAAFAGDGSHVTLTVTWALRLGSILTQALRSAYRLERTA